MSSKAGNGNAYGISVRKPEGKRTLESPKLRWGIILKRILKK
jgi:hypothetical protein